MQATGNPIMNLIPLVFFIFIIYFIILRPQQKKQKEHKALLEALKKNDEIVTAGGVHGTIVNIKEKTYVIRIDDNVKMEIDKPSVSYVEKKKES